MVTKESARALSASSLLLSRNKSDFSSYLYSGPERLLSAEPRRYFYRAVQLGRQASILLLVLAKEVKSSFKRAMGGEGGRI